MLPYFVVLGGTAILAVVSEWPKYAKSAGLLATLILVLLAGLRFQTGYDWDIYQGYFERTPTLWEIINGQQFPDYAETLYVALNVALRTLGANFEILLFIATAVSLLVAHSALQRISSGVAVAWLAYFGIAFLIGQMTLVRQSLASSFVLLALVMFAEKKPIKGLASQALALGFQFSTAFFIPVIILARFYAPPLLAAILLLPGALIAAMGFDLIDNLQVLASVAPEALRYRIALYSSLPASPITLGSLSLIIFHVAVLSGLYLFQGDRRDPLVRTAIWLCLLVLGFHLYLWALPNGWNRIMLVALPFEVAVLWRVWKPGFFFRYDRFAAIVALFVFSGTALVYFLHKPTAVPFVPYQSTVEVYLTGECGDGAERQALGRARSMYAFTPTEEIPEEIIEIERERVEASLVTPEEKDDTRTSCW